ncbi:MAG: 50S ribosomal protein L11 methyltransferase, partial [Thiohalomonadales bacterium]|nr:50S ribosomal protein L11 methyltransferase [Thiohalomonadales bacterium]
WMDNFQPMQFGKQLWICPSGFTPPAPGAINIQLDPGLAFGTGTHPTTAMCLRWLDAHPPRDMRVIDYGCGSGILGIAACKLGARQVISVDTDPQALLATQANAEKNHVADCIQAYLPADIHPEPVPLLLANILARPLHSLAPLFAELVTPGGQLVLSGILTEQAEDLRQQYQPAFDMKLVAQEEEWVCLAGQRR